MFGSKRVAVHHHVTMPHCTLHSHCTLQLAALRIAKYLLRKIWPPYIQHSIFYFLCVIKNTFLQDKSKRDSKKKFEKNNSNDTAKCDENFKIKTPRLLSETQKRVPPTFSVEMKTTWRRQIFFTLRKTRASVGPAPSRQPTADIIITR